MAGQVQITNRTFIDCQLDNGQTIKKQTSKYMLSMALLETAGNM
jgi:hypothetical protein